MNKLNLYLVTIIGFGWLSFLLAGILLNQVFAAPNFVLLIERSYCPPQKWEQVVQNYTNLHRQHQQNLIKIESVVLFNDLGQEVVTTIPSPEELRSLRTYGRSNPQRKGDLKKTYSRVKVLDCL